VRWTTYRARWRGEELRATPEQRFDGLWVWLVAPRATVGFDAVTDDGPWVRQVPAADCDVLLLVRTAGTWRGLPVHVHDERTGDGGGDLLVEYAGGSTPEAAAAGFERVARGVHRRWVLRDEVRGLREDTALLD